MLQAVMAAALGQSVANSVQADRRRGVRANPAASLIVATDKKAGLYVYGLDGRTRSFAAGGRLNNVDLMDMGAAGVIVVASDRNDPLSAMLRIYRLDTASAWTAVHDQAVIHMKRRTSRYDSRSRDSAVEAVSIMMIGASIRSASGNTTPP